MGEEREKGVSMRQFIVLQIMLSSQQHHLPPDLPLKLTDFSVTFKVSSFTSAMARVTYKVSVRWAHLVGAILVVPKAAMSN